MRRFVKWGCLGGLGLLALIVVFGVIGAMLMPPQAPVATDSAQQQAYTGLPDGHYRLLLPPP